MHREVRDGSHRGRDGLGPPGRSPPAGVDYRTLEHGGKRIDVAHTGADTISLICHTLSLRDRMTGRLRRGQWIGLAGTITLSVGGVLGGHLAHKLPGRQA